MWWKIVYLPKAFSEIFDLSVCSSCCITITIVSDIALLLTDHTCLFCLLHLTNLAHTSLPIFTHHYECVITVSAAATPKVSPCHFTVSAMLPKFILWRDTGLVQNCNVIFSKFFYFAALSFVFIPHCNPRIYVQQFYLHLRYLHHMYT